MSKAGKRKVGAEEGDADGATLTVGAMVGRVEGAAVGLALIVGAPVGAAEGDVDGAALFVGALVGLVDGGGVGLRVRVGGGVGDEKFHFLDGAGAGGPVSLGSTITSSFLKAKTRLTERTITRTATTMIPI